MFDRIFRAIKLDSSFYREAAGTPAWMMESFLVVLAAAFLSALGKAFGSDQHVLTFVSQIFNEIVLGWLLWSVIAYFVGNNFLGGKSKLEEVIRVLGYANAPRLLGFFGFIPCIGWLFSLGGAILSLIAGIIALREVMGFDSGKAVATAIIGWILYVIASIILGVLFIGMTLPFRF